MRAPRPPSRGAFFGALVAAIAAGAVALPTGCSGRQNAETSPPTPPAAVLQIAALPQMGPAPLAVEFVASLEGPIQDEGALACPSVAWSFGDGPAQIDALNCTDVPQRIFRASHTYASPGAYEASVRLLAAGIDASYPLQVIVQGATATPQPEAVLGFPPSVTEATAAPDDSSGQVAHPPDGTPPNAPVSAPPAGAPAPVAAAMNLTLPADLYLLAGSPARVWRRPAIGGALELVDLGVPPVADLAVSASHDLAVVDGSGIALWPQDGTVLRLQDGAAAAAPNPLQGAAGARDLVWSPDGSRLAWRADGVWVAAARRSADGRAADGLSGGEEAGGEVAGSEDFAIGAAPGDWSAALVGRATGTPLALDNRGALLIRAADGQIAVYDTASGTLAALPIRGAAEGGWLASGPVAWLAGPGLRLLTVQDPLQLSPLLDDAAVRAAAEAPSGRLVVLVGQGDSYQAVAFDLAGASLAAEPLGEAFALGAGQMVAWSANGAVLALAGPGGLEVLEPATGRRELLVAEPVVKAAWGRPASR